VILEGAESEKGIIAHKSRTFAVQYSELLGMDQSNLNGNSVDDNLYLKMNGRKVYEFALTNVPELIRLTLEKCNLQLNDIDKILIHQANNKMDEAIVQRLFRLCKVSDIPEGIMPMTIGWLGNSSVATIPTLLDLTTKGKLNGHILKEGHTVVMASVGAGMNINAIVYRF
jgi:3-oxoacyl-[acyl-carrier-protein] synthase-3